MSKVLIYKKVVPMGEYDLFSQTDDSKIASIINDYYAGECFNVGNKLWLQGIMSVIDTGENEYDFLNDGITPDYVNKTYNFVILPMANIFNSQYAHYIVNMEKFFNEIKVPVYVIACGAQAKSYDELDKLVADIGDISKGFISSIYRTGGEFALRGHFTKRFFEKLGFSSAVVTGCPSIFQMGSTLKISDKRVDKKEFSVAINGNAIYNKNLRTQVKKSYFVDQDCYFHDIYRDIKTNMNRWLLLYQTLGFDGIRLIKNKDRAKLFFDMNKWRNWFINERVSFSFGTRIHGSIMPILSGVPSMLCCEDTRTREMAEFFNIPHKISGDMNLDEIDLYSIYENTDYSEFNNSFPQKFDYYESFLKSCGIVGKINVHNRFFSD